VATIPSTSDFIIVLTCYREIADLEWSEFEFGRAAVLHVRRAKNGKPSGIRPARAAAAISGFNLRLRDRTRRPFTPDVVNRPIKRIGDRAGLAFPVHAHMLWHACGYALPMSGATRDWPSHRSIQRTTRYTQSSAAPFKVFPEVGA
jgi:type 1 fimbriae regulatory protein FimB/type 1 fimbriae regulatory protein FimE